MEKTMNCSPDKRRAKVIHKLKTINPYFQYVRSGMKKFEIRKNDRDFQVGDELLLEEYVPVDDFYTGEICHKRIDYILDGGQFGISEDYVVMSISNPCQP